MSITKYKSLKWLILSVSIAHARNLNLISDARTAQNRKVNKDIYSLAPDRTPYHQQNSLQSYLQQQNTPQIPRVQHPKEENPLVKQASVISVCILFILLTWRSLSAYELADQFTSSLVRTIAVAPSVGILLLNMVGFVINAMKPYSFKNQLKAILAINIIREIVELMYNMLMLIMSTAISPIPREVYFGRFFMSVWWLLLLTKFSKSRWVMTSTSTFQQDQNKGLNGNQNSTF